MPISTAARSALVSATPLPPLPHLPSAQQEVWRALVNAMPATYFGPDNVLLLEQLVNHVIYARRLAAQLETAPAALHPKLLQQHAAQSAALAMLCTKLRLTPLSHYRGSKTGAPRSNAYQPARKPWELLQEHDA
jgi:hypothetical protein